MVNKWNKISISYFLTKGWQPRYFVLNETGILSYYKSRELIHEGCKGSCLVLACEIKGKIIRENYQKKKKFFWLFFLK
jgi:hypothetical protein